MKRSDFLKPEVLFRLLLMAASFVLTIVGAVMLFGYLGWFGLAGLFLFLWGNNISLAIAQKREESRMKERARLEAALTRLLERAESREGVRTP